MKGRHLWMLVPLLILLCACGVLVSRVADRRQAAADYDWAAELAGLTEPTASAPAESVLPHPSDEPQAEPGTTEEDKKEPPATEPGAPSVPDPYAQALAEMDFRALQAVNGDVIGWIWIPGTNISYPLLQSGDNSRYLDHTWTGRRSSAGAIFLDSRCSGDLSDAHCVIYGHRMLGGSMFGGLRRYSDAAYLAAHPEVYVATESGTARYRIFAAYEADVSDGTYRLSFLDEAAWTAYLEAQGVTGGGKLLTLSTCTALGSRNKRWVVRAIAQ